MRRAHDFYPTTDAGATRGLLTLAPVPFQGTCLECCSGEHHMTAVLKESGVFSSVLTNDVVPSCQADYHEDARDERVWREVFPPVDWVITNPPFGYALEIVQMALRYARLGVAFYLRISFWEPTMKGRNPQKRRGLFLQEHPPNGFMPMSRISHTEDGGTDSATCGWFVWDKSTEMQWHRVLILGQQKDRGRLLEA